MWRVASRWMRGFSYDLLATIFRPSALTARWSSNYSERPAGGGGVLFAALDESGALNADGNAAPGGHRDHGRDGCDCSNCVGRDRRDQHGGGGQD